MLPDSSSTVYCLSTVNSTANYIKCVCEPSVRENLARNINCHHQELVKSVHNRVLNATSSASQLHDICENKGDENGSDCERIFDVGLL